MIMAKRKKLDTPQPIQTPSLTEDKPIPTPTIKVEATPLRDTILDLREKGFDDNRIAARLMIQKSIVEHTK